MNNKESTRYASSIQENRIASKFNGVVNPNSGAGLWKKGDVYVPSAKLLIECKTCLADKKSFSIKKEWIEKDKKEAFMSRANNSIIAFNFGFENSDDYYVIDDKLAKFLIEKLSEEAEG